MTYVIPKAISPSYLTAHQITMIMKINEIQRELLLESLEELMYKTSLELNELKGGPLDSRRKELTRKQKEVEKLQHQVSTANTEQGLS